MSSQEQSGQAGDGKRDHALDAVEAVVAAGKAVISGDDSTVVAAVVEAIRSGRTATFYLSHGQAQAVNALYWTPERIRQLGMEPVAPEERQRIEQALGVPDTGHLYSNRIECQCGQVYGGFEFVQQGIAEHGREMVGHVLGFKETSVIRVNPPTVAICTNCNRKLLAGHYYCWVNGYGCCRSAELISELPVRG